MTITFEEKLILFEKFNNHHPVYFSNDEDLAHSSYCYLVNCENCILCTIDCTNIDFTIEETKEVMKLYPEYFV